MAGDRWLTLAVQAVKNNVYDYTDHDCFDVKSIVRERLILGEVEKENLLKTNYTYLDSLIAWMPHVRNESREDAHGKFADTINKIQSLLFPYVKQESRKTTPGSDPKALLEKWERLFGKIDSPEVQEQLNSLRSAKSSKIQPTAKPSTDKVTWVHR